jgi:hypothetical protein
LKIDYIRRLAEAYVMDNQLYNEKLTPDDLYENFYGLIKDIRVNQPYMYQTIHESNKFVQQKIFTNYFDLTFKKDVVFEDVEILDEIAIEMTLGTIGTILLGWIAVKKFNAPISRPLFRLINAVTTKINQFGKSISEFGGHTRLAFAIIQTNSRKCYDQCNFNPDTAKLTDYMTQHSKGGLVRELGRTFQSEEDETKMDCLRSCYLYTMKEVVKLSAHTYFTCLKNTGDLSKLPLERDFSAYQTIIIKSGLNASCDSLSTLLKDAMSNFNEVLNLIYDDEPVEARKHKNDLMMDIYNIQKEFTGNFQVKSFPQRPQGGQSDRPRIPFQKRN